MKLRPLQFAALRRKQRGFLMNPFRFSGGGSGGTASDPYFSNVVLLMPLDGTNGSTSIPDVSPRPKKVDAWNGAAISTAQSVFGGASCYFDGVNDYLATAVSSDFHLGSGDFTIEGRLRIENTTAQQAIVCRRGSGFAAGDWEVVRTPDGKLGFFSYDQDSAGNLIVQGTAPNNQWFHWAVTRSGNTLRLFIDGVLAQSATFTATIADNNLGILVGREIVSGGRFYFQGYQDDLRITKGVARYGVAGFTPPAAPFTAAASDSILLHFDGTHGANTFTDSSTTPKTVAIHTGTPTLTTASKKFGTAAINFPGSSGIKVNQPAGQTFFNFGTGDWTVEGWWAHATGAVSSGLHGFWSFGECNPARLYIDAGVVKLQLGAGAAVTIASSALTFEAGRFYHMAATRKGSDVFVFRDGVLIASGTYSSAMDAGDGANFFVGCVRGDVWFWNGQADEVRITKGFAHYSRDFTPPASAHVAQGPVLDDGSYAANALLLHFDGANGSTTFTDNSPTPKIVTAANATISTAQSRWGGASGVFSGTNSSLTVADSADTRMGTGNWTAEGWCMYTGAGSGSYDSIFALGSGSDVVNLRFSDGGAGNALQLLNYNGGSNPAHTSSHTRTSRLNKWFHFAVACEGTTIRLFVDGVLSGSITRATSMANGRIVLGNWPEWGFWFKGHIDEFRLTKGVARYTATFAPPAAPFADSAPAKIALAYTGAEQTYIVPAGKTSLTVKLWGAGGGGAWQSYGSNGGSGGGAGYVTGTLAVTPGETLTVLVGGGGGQVNTGGTQSGGWGGGGTGHGGGNQSGGGGGGRTEIRRGATVLAVAAGGAGGGSTTQQGGAGGGTTGLAGGGSMGGNGGTQSAGGTLGATGGNTAATVGSANTGGNGGGSDGAGGGGGAGYYGGAGGGGSGSQGAGGGGGSSYIGGLTGATTTAGASSVPGGDADTDRSGAGTGGGNATAGSNGRAVFIE